MLQYLPNCLTFSRLLLAVPLGLLILREQYDWALVIGVVAGVTDALDGFFARRLNALSRFGAILDPIADKVLITVTFVCLAAVDVVPWYLSIAVIARDLIIVTGAIAYYTFIGPFEFGATKLSKSNMALQIAFCVLVLLSQVLDTIPSELTLAGTAAVLFLAAASGFDYVMSWTIKAFQSRKTKE
ncbi:CDP-diacylglycerol--glycerol-3-phosphate 3-phosphatidyltransferase [Halioglobus japonicus]|nr:CDP-diacylglycerol--glycerol-3-phosphate 3-phosphatidyltransferase [Halioglobus japonicus]